MAFSISRSSTALSAAASISPHSRLPRASFSAAGRNRLPTWSARKGGLARCTGVLFGRKSYGPRRKICDPRDAAKAGAWMERSTNREQSSHAMGYPATDWSGLLRRAARRHRQLLQNEVVLDEIVRHIDVVAVGRLAGGMFGEVDDQRLFHPIDHVGLGVVAAALEQVSDAA